jgi:hypothetical protein
LKNKKTHARQDVSEPIKNSKFRGPAWIQNHMQRKFEMRKLVLGAMLFMVSSVSLAQTTPTCPAYIDIRNNAAWNRELLKSAITSIPACDTSKLATKADLQAAVATLTAAIAAIPTAGPAPTPTPAPTPVPAGVGGIFIGTTEFQHLADAGAAYKSGDTIHITKSLDNESAALVTGDVTVVCDPGVKLTWSGGTSVRPAWGKGVFAVEGSTKNFTIKNCDISGVILDGGQGGNAAAVRMAGTGAQVLDTATFDGINFHDNNNGILGGAHTLTITNSKFSHNGVFSGGTANVHNIYISDTTDTLNVSNSYFGKVTPAHLFKSRAKATNVTSCQFETFADTDGSYLIDLPNGGNAVVQKSVFLKAPGQSQRGMFAFGEEGLTADGRVNNYEFKNNIVINDGNARFLNQSGGVMNFHDNTIVGTPMDGIEPLQAGVNNKFFGDRVSAGLGASPMLPAAPAM